MDGRAAGCRKVGCPCKNEIVSGSFGCTLHEVKPDWIRRCVEGLRHVTWSEREQHSWAKNIEAHIRRCYEEQKGD